MKTTYTEENVKLKHAVAVEVTSMMCHVGAFIGYCITYSYKFYKLLGKLDPTFIISVLWLVVALALFCYTFWTKINL